MFLFITYNPFSFNINTSLFFVCTKLYFKTNYIPGTIDFNETGKLLGQYLSYLGILTICMIE